MIPQNARRRQRARTETAESWLIFAVSYPFCLASVALRRVAGARSEAGLVPAARRSLFVEAHAEASLCSHAAFMG